MTGFTVSLLNARALSPGPSESIIGEFRQQYAAKHGDEKAAALEFYTKFVTQDASLSEVTVVATGTLAI